MVNVHFIAFALPHKKCCLILSIVHLCNKTYHVLKQLLVKQSFLLDSQKSHASNRQTGYWGGPQGLAHRFDQVRIGEALSLGGLPGCNTKSLAMAHDG